jgi:hypothetical protein
MNPELDQFLVFLAIGMALGFFVWRKFRHGRGKACGGCCGKKTQAPAAKKRP